MLESGGKWRNLQKRQLADFIPLCRSGPMGSKGASFDAVIHFGAISSTTAIDGDLVINSNFRLSKRLLDWCTVNSTRFIYASSAATYGDEMPRALPMIFFRTDVRFCGSGR